jgi:hypothetical protein
MGLQGEKDRLATTRQSAIRAYDTVCPGNLADLAVRDVVGHRRRLRPCLKPRLRTSSMKPGTKEKQVRRQH